MPENLDLVRSIYAAWERGDYGSVAWAHPDIEFVWVGGVNPEAWNGIAEMANGWRAILSAFDGWRAIPDEFRVLDEERVLVLAKGTGKGKTSGAPIAHQGATVFTIRDGLVTRVVGYPERERALTDLGLEE